MAKAMKGLIFFYDMIPTLKRLRDKDAVQAVNLVIDMLSYAKDGTIPEELGDIEPMFWVYQDQIDRTKESYEETIAKRSAAGQKGGIASGESRRAEANEANKANASDRSKRSKCFETKQTEANEANEAITITNTKTITKTKTKTEEGPPVEAAPPPVSPRRVIDDYNAICSMLPHAELNDSRKAAIGLAVKDGFTQTQIREAFMRVARSSFLTGGAKNGWVASFDWIIKPESLQKIKEGNYDDRKPSDRKGGKGKTGFHNFEERNTDFNAMVENVTGVKGWD